ncbi:MAG TPA: pseudouridine synthase [Candidatus Wallbacteria bacterium]|nr:pseudouridine synthase [Candidatus Wallbacteria bacterium]
MMINKDKKTTTGKSFKKNNEKTGAKFKSRPDAAPKAKTISFNSQDGVCALYRALSKLSVCSRTAAKEYITGGRVMVNGTIINDMMYSVNLKKDKIKVDGKAVSEKKYQYIAFNKPAGYETSCRASIKSAKTIYELIPFAKANGLNPAGWLDKESRGLIILTNDNAFSDKISGGNSKLAKHYMVKTNADIDEEQIKEFAHGIVITDGTGSSVKTRPCSIKHAGECAYEVALTQGINRQIRKMFEYFGVKVVDLFRYKIGKLEIADDNEGTFFNIKPEDITGVQTDKTAKKKV